MRQIKLIPGKMNFPYIKVKAGYAEGSNKPKRIKKVKVFNAIIIPIELRKAA